MKKLHRKGAKSQRVARQKMQKNFALSLRLCVFAVQDIAFMLSEAGEHAR
ncbi:MAG: hypothetical protein Q8L40_09500 [Burkholderiales bacterium]|nr:hypothetical protein [Burkholderiales bacterium]